MYLNQEMPQFILICPQRSINSKFPATDILTSKMYFNSSCLIKPWEMILSFILLHGVTSSLKSRSLAIFKSWLCTQSHYPPFPKCVTAHAAAQMVKLNSVSCVGQEKIRQCSLQGGEEKSYPPEPHVNFCWCLWGLHTHRRWIQAVPFPEKLASLSFRHATRVKYNNQFFSVFFHKRISPK